MRRRGTRGLPGASPGTLEHRGERFVERPTLRAHFYDAEHAWEETIPHGSLPRPPAPQRLWLEVTGVHDVALMERLGATYGIPALALEDAMATYQRPKFEEFPDGGFVVLRMMQWIDGRLDDEQVSIWWSGDRLLSFQEKPGDCLEAIRRRIARPGSRIRQHGSPYLAYALADAVVDHMFVVLDAVGEHLASLEEAILEDWRGTPLGLIQEARRTLLSLRRAAAPVRDVAAAMMHSASMPRDVQPYLRDLHDHCVQALDLVEQQREIAAGLRDLWMNAQAAHMNRVMQTLTVIATIFIPLTFLAGIYGMNFEHMPELSEPWAYPAFLVFCLVLGVGLLVSFRIRGWLGGE